MEPAREKDPGLQTAQLPVDVWYDPASQLEHAVDPIGALFPTGQAAQLDAPVDGWYAATAHEAHALDPSLPT
jgi:hypothetical protein